MPEVLCSKLAKINSRHSRDGNKKCSGCNKKGLWRHIECSCFVQKQTCDAEGGVLWLSELPKMIGI